MRLIFSLLTLASFAGGSWYAWENVAPIRQFVETQVNSGEFQTLEIRYTAKEIMESNKANFLKNKGYSFLEPKTLYQPYLLMDVKYSKSNSTVEGTLLWSLADGEMVIDTASWTKTHGFEDCLLAKADKNDFKILRTLVENGGMVDRERMYQRFKIDHDILDDWIDSCRSKKLIVISGNKFRLHFEDPHIEVEPVTHIGQALVTQPTKFSAKVKKRYSINQIRKLTEIAFRGDFTIRKTEEVFLPVYQIGIQNPDGSTRSLYFNALNGKRLSL